MAKIEKPEDYDDIKQVTGWFSGSFLNYPSGPRGMGYKGWHPDGINPFSMQSPSVGRFSNDMPNSSLNGSNGGSVVPGIATTMAPPTINQGSRLADLEDHPSGSGSGYRTPKPLFNPLPEDKSM